MSEIEVRQNKLDINKINARLFLVVCLIGFGFFGVQILITSQVGTKSTEIEIIRKEKDQLRLENEIIKSKINEARSLTNSKEVIEKYQLQEKPIYSLDRAGQSDIASL